MDLSKTAVICTQNYQYGVLGGRGGGQGAEVFLLFGLVVFFLEGFFIL